MFDLSFFKNWDTKNKIFYNPHDQYIGKAISNNEKWEWWLHKLFIPNKEGDILDIGANIGCHTIAMAQINPNRIIHSFEPQQYQFYALNTNLINNKLYNVKTYNVALGNKKDISRFPAGFSNPDFKNFGGASLLPNYHYIHDDGNQYEGSKKIFENTGEIVNIITLDSLNLNKIALIKVDIEGYEKEFLEGAKNTILANKPNIIIEIHKDDKEKDVKKLLTEYGYTINNVKNGAQWDYFCTFQ